VTGLTIKQETNTIHKLIKWDEINSAIIKLYKQQYGFASFLLLKTKNDNIIEINISLLKPERSGFCHKTVWKNTVHLEEPDFQKIKILLGKYLKTN